MAVSVNGVAIPAPMRDRGSYIYKRFGIKVDNGLGVTQTAGLPSAVWTFPSLPLSDYSWWTTTILAGAASREVPAVLWDDDNNEVTFASVVVRYPESPDGIKGGRYKNVQIIIDTMVEA